MNFGITIAIMDMTTAAKIAVVTLVVILVVIDLLSLSAAVRLSFPFQYTEVVRNILHI